jgi:hypothetical protein
MREVTHFVVVFPTRLMSSSYEDKKALMDALRREYPHYEFDALEAFDIGIADDDDFGVVPVTGRVGEGDNTDQVYLCKPLDPTVIPDLMRALQRCEANKPLLN